MKLKNSISKFTSFSAFFLLFFAFSIPYSQAKTSSLRIGITGSAPFVIHKDSTQNSGISLEIWEGIAAHSNWNYSYKYYDEVSSALQALQQDELDVIVGPLSITSERMKSVKFTQPYFQSGLSIISRADPKGIIDRIKPFFSFKLLIAVGIFVFILALVGTLFWLAERKESPEQFPMKPSSGIGNGMWLAIVTMSTTGYGDRAPITFWGRIIAGCWMVISIIFATSMVAGIASTLTLSGIEKSEITNAKELRNHKTGVIKNSPAADFAEENNANLVFINNLEDGYQKLKNKKIDALLFDRPQMLYFLKQNDEDNIAISPYEYDKLGYGFATQLNSTITHQLNINLLSLAESGNLSNILHEWLGDYEKRN